MQKLSAISQTFPILKNVPLFNGISENDLYAMLDCLNARIVQYEKNNIIFLAGDPVSRVGIVCSGGVQLVREDMLENRAIMASLSAGDIFGETFACARIERLPVSVVATSDCEILLIDYRRIVTTCPSTCVFHGKLVENMLEILADKNLMLNQKIEALSARSIRGKLLAYLTAQAQRSGSYAFKIPFNRQELADYLSVDRSAMSAELGKMRDDGLLRFHKNDFEIMKPG